jgi:hypothetical protein
MAKINSVFVSVDKDVKIFGVTQNLGSKVEEDETKGLKCCIVMMPLGWFSKFWALVITLTLMVSGIQIPYSAAFDVDFKIMNFFMDCIFLCDIFLGFFTGYIRKDGQTEK